MKVYRVVLLEFEVTGGGGGGEIVGTYGADALNGPGTPGTHRAYWYACDRPDIPTRDPTTPRLDPDR